MNLGVLKKTLGNLLESNQYKTGEEESRIRIVERQKCKIKTRCKINMTLTLHCCCPSLLLTLHCCCYTALSDWFAFSFYIQRAQYISNRHRYIYCGKFIHEKLGTSFI